MKDEVREGGTEGGREGGREGGEGRREGGREEGRKGGREEGMNVIHILIGMFNSNPMIPHYSNYNMTSYYVIA